jgi:hypothetical protein
MSKEAPNLNQATRRETSRTRLQQTGPAHQPAIFAIYRLVPPFPAIGWGPRDANQRVGDQEGRTKRAVGSPLLGFARSCSPFLGEEPPNTQARGICGSSSQSWPARSVGTPWNALVRLCTLFPKGWSGNETECRPRKCGFRRPLTSSFSSHIYRTQPKRFEIAASYSTIKCYAGKPHRVHALTSFDFAYTSRIHDSPLAAVHGQFGVKPERHWCGLTRTSSAFLTKRIFPLRAIGRGTTTPFANRPGAQWKRKVRKAGQGALDANRRIDVVFLARRAAGRAPKRRQKRI